MQLRTRALLRTLPAPSTSLPSPPRTRMRARAGTRSVSSSSSSLSTSPTSVDTLNPLFPTSSSTSDVVRRSRRVATLSSAQQQQQQPRTSAVTNAQDQFATRAATAQALDNAIAPPAPARVRRKPIKVPSAVVPTTVTRAAKDVKCRRVSVGSEERKRMQLCLLQSALSSEDDRIDETSWLTSTLMDLLLWRLANQYPTVHFLPTDFFHCFLESRSRSQHDHHSQQQSHHRRSSSVQQPTPRDFIVRDVLGRLIDYASDRPILFAVNSGLIHWNLFRVQLVPEPELQLFEPMGRLASRTGLSYRAVPRSVVEWLEVCYPQHSHWITKAVSAITTRQQVSGFDCGVACLLYADKCGQGQTRDEINSKTDQRAITRFRKTLQQQLRAMQSSVAH